MTGESMRLLGILCVVLSATCGVGCGNEEREQASARESHSPIAPSSITGAGAAAPSLLPGLSGMSGGEAGDWAARDFTFPPRDQPYDFRVNALEAKYRDGLRRGVVSTFVDAEGDIVWIQEYLRYRVNLCGHEDAVQRVFTQIRTGVIAPTCGASGTAVVFPPRNEPFDFRQRLEVLYRDTLRRGTSQTFVDIEGDIVWTQEYLRYRLTGCGHGESVDKVLTQIDGRGIQPPCGGATVPGPSLPAAPRALFTVISDADTLQQRIVNAGQCAATQSGSNNVLRCTFDAGASTPNPGITLYEWTFDGQYRQTGMRLSRAEVPCGSFPANITNKQVTLRVTSPGGSQSTTATVTFVKAGAC